MKGQDEIVALLNDILTAELTAISQYFVHARMCDRWGYERLAKRLREESIGEMRHADRLIQRVLYLEGMPNVQRLGKITIGETVPEQLRGDLEAERNSIVKLNDAIELCRAQGDNGTRELLEHMLRDSEGYANWLEAQLSLIGHVGEANYLAQQITSVLYS